jgi:D-alanyl-D-alanine carboxypeptidase
MKRIKYIIILFFLALIGFGLLYSYFNYQFWTHLQTRNFKGLAEYKGDNLVGFRGQQILVHQTFLPHLKKIANYAKSNEIIVIITQSYRYKEQELNKKVVSPSKTSNHLAGYAIDFNLIYEGDTYFSDDLYRENLSSLPQNIQNFIQNIRDDKDLRWGGDFSKEDPVHIDSPLNVKKPPSWKEYATTCHKDFSEAIPVWKLWE